MNGPSDPKKNINERLSNDEKLDAFLKTHAPIAPALAAGHEKRAQEVLDRSKNPPKQTLSRGSLWVGSALALAAAVAFLVLQWVPGDEALQVPTEDIIVEVLEDYGQDSEFTSDYGNWELLAEVVAEPTVGR